MDAVIQRPIAQAVVFEEAPLGSVIDRLRDLTGVPFVLDMKSLEEAGLDPNVPITANVPPSSLRFVLHLLLADLDLTYLIQNDTLRVTTMDEASMNPVVYIYPLPGQIASPTLIDLIQATVAAAGIPATDSKAIPTRLYAVRDERQLQELAHKLVPLCNAALGAAGDPDAKVTAIAGTLAVQSRKRGFHAYAAEMIRAITDVDVTIPEYHGVSGSIDTNTMSRSWMGMSTDKRGTAGMGLCWVAREVFGADSPRWLAFRDWLVGDAPPWLRSVYATHGESFARWLRFRPTARLAVRLLMNAVLAAKHDRLSGIQPAHAFPTSIQE